MAVKKLTQTIVDDAEFDMKPRAPKTQYIWDAKVVGLGLRLFPSGRHKWYLRYTRRSDNRPRTMPLAFAGQVSLKDARNAAQQYLARVILGADPLGEKIETRVRRNSGPTLTDLRERYRNEIEARNAEVTRRKKGIHWRKILEFFGEKTPLEEIRREEVLALFQHLSDQPNTANEVVHKLLAQALRMAAENWTYPDGSPWYPHRLPTKGIARHPERKRLRSFTGKEMRRILDACRELLPEHPAAYSAIPLIATTGARTGEITGSDSSAKWSGYQPEFRKLVLPRGKGDTHEIQGRQIFVPDVASEALERLQQLRRSDWLVPGHRAGNTLSGASLRKYFEHVAKVAGLSKVGDDAPTPHVLRHTFITVADEAGIPFQMIGRLVGHRLSGSMTARYSHPSDRILAQHANQAGEALMRYAR